MASSEFLIVAGIIIVGILFFVAAQTFITSSGEEALESKYRSEAEELVQIINKISKFEGNVVYEKKISYSNVSVKDGVLIYRKNGYEFRFLVPSIVEDSQIVGATELYIKKENDKIILSEKSEKCNYDFICQPEECSVFCSDCAGPSDICKGDGICNKEIGENCENSPNDCKCDANKVCCPSSQDADEIGCSNTKDLDKGKRCWCTNQCKAGLECNPTTPEFKDYEKACCEDGKSWNGNDCVVVECKYPCVPGCKLPKKWDWRNVDGVNYLNPVRDQGFCGSCWAFSAVGAVEGTYNVEQNCPGCNRDLSEQNLVSSCCPAGSCKGGEPHLALEYIKSNGIVDESCFPYTSSFCMDVSRNCLPQCSCGGGVCSNPCNCNLCTDYINRLWRIKNYGIVNSNLDDIKRAVICHGPLLVGSMNWEHAIVLVGYDDNTERWIIRNSWGPGWGDGGYGYIPYTGHPYSDLRNYVYYVEGVTK